MLRAPGAPVTRASPTVIITASTLLAANASIDGVYSNHENSTSTPASLNQPFWMPTSKAVHPGQSEKAIFSGGFPVGFPGLAIAPAGGGVSGAAWLRVPSPVAAAAAVIATNRRVLGVP